MGLRQSKCHRLLYTAKALPKVCAKCFISLVFLIISSYNNIIITCFRNLFFRTVYLLLADIQPIFVLEGDAPELKRDVMAARNALQFRGAPSQSSKTSDKPDVARRRFRGVLKEV